MPKTLLKNRIVRIKEQTKEVAIYSNPKVGIRVNCNQCIEKVYRNKKANFIVFSHGYLKFKL